MNFDNISTRLISSAASVCSTTVNKARQLKQGVSNHISIILSCRSENVAQRTLTRNTVNNATSKKDTDQRLKSIDRIASNNIGEKSIYQVDSDNQEEYKDDKKERNLGGSIFSSSSLFQMPDYLDVNSNTSKADSTLPLDVNSNTSKADSTLPLEPSSPLSEATTAPTTTTKSFSPEIEERLDVIMDELKGIDEKDLPTREVLGAAIEQALKLFSHGRPAVVTVKVQVGGQSNIKELHFKLTKQLRNAENHPEIKAADLHVYVPIGKLGQGSFGTVEKYLRITSILKKSTDTTKKYSARKKIIEENKKSKVEELKKEHKIANMAAEITENNNTAKIISYNDSASLQMRYGEKNGAAFLSEMREMQVSNPDNYLKNLNQFVLTISEDAEKIFKSELIGADLKEENILFIDGRPCLIDFGGYITGDDLVEKMANLPEENIKRWRGIGQQKTIPYESKEISEQIGLAEEKLISKITEVNEKIKKETNPEIKKTLINEKEKFKEEFINEYIKIKNEGNAFSLGVTMYRAAIGAKANNTDELPFNFNRFLGLSTEGEKKYESNDDSNKKFQELKKTDINLYNYIVSLLEHPEDFKSYNSFLQNMEGK